MLASQSLLMPDLPGNGPPSSAPLSREDADRLADSFTPFWEDDVPAAPAPSPAVAAPPAPIPPAQAPATVVAAPPTPSAVPAPLAPAATKPLLKQTLLGIAPINLTGGAPARAPSPSVPAPAPQPVSAPPLLVTDTQPMPAQPAQLAASTARAAVTSAPPPPPPEPILAPQIAVPTPAPAPVPLTQPQVEAAPSVLAVVNRQTLPGVSPDVEVPPAAEPGPMPVPAADVPGYAVAYAPKDGPATPAVVIAPEAQAPPEPRKPAALTMPAQVRSAPMATPIAAPELDELDSYPKKKSKGPLVLAAFGAALLLLAIGGIRALSGSSARSNAATTAALAPTTPPSVTAAPAATQAAPNAEPSPAAAPPTPPPEPVAAPAGAPTSEPATTHASTAKTTARHGKVVRAAPTPAAAKSSSTKPREPFPAEPAATPKASPSKSVIVRDNPF